MPKHVLIVDDDYGSAHLIKMLLEMEGFVTTICMNNDEAVLRCQNGVDAFVIDLYLAKGQSGLDLLQAIRMGETRAAIQTPVVIVSGDVRREEEAMRAGADRFLLKPYSPFDLSKQLRTLIAKEGA
jgi:CheY-like chemotaxis protein